MSRRETDASELHVRIGRIAVEDGAVPTGALPDRDSLARAIAARLGGRNAEAPPSASAIAAAIADAVAHRMPASWPPVRTGRKP